MALMLRHDSDAGSSAASMTFRWMPLDQKSRPPSRHRTRVGRERAWRSCAGESAALLGAHGAVVEVERQIADLAVFPVVNVAISPVLERRSIARSLCGTPHSQGWRTWAAGSLIPRGGCSGAFAFR